MSDMRKIIRKMKRFGNKLSSLSKIVLYVTMLIYIFYMLHVMLDYSENDTTDQNLKPESFVAVFSPNPAFPSLFKIPKRKFTHAAVTTTGLPSLNISNKCTVTIAIILCEDDRYLSITKTNHTGSVYNTTSHNQHSTGKPAIAKNFSRQINQTLVLLKSIAILSKFQVSRPQEHSPSSCVEVLLLSDKPTHYKTISRELKSKWAMEFQQFLKITHVPVRYPPGSAWMRKLFRPCATLRLFLSELLPDHDSVIYLDTDVIFFQSVQALWAQFSRFDGSHNHNNIQDASDKSTSRKIAAMAPCLFHYGSSANSVPYFGSSGLNAGIMLMNLTGMRWTQWTNKIRMVTTMFQDKIKLADQDILNIYFHFFPEELHMLSCDWNFRPFQCRAGSYCEDAQLSHGISALHGNALSFTPQGPEPLFRAIYQTFHWTKLDRNFSIVEFVDRLETALLKAEETTTAHNSDCKRYGGFNVVALNRLYNIVERIEQKLGRVI